MWSKLVIPAFAMIISIYGHAAGPMTIAQASASIRDARFEKFFGVLQRNYKVSCNIPEATSVARATEVNCAGKSDICVFRFKVRCLGEPTLEDVVVNTVFEGTSDYVGDMSFQVSFQQ